MVISKTPVAIFEAWLQPWDEGPTTTIALNPSYVTAVEDFGERIVIHTPTVHWRVVGDWDTVLGKLGWVP